MSTERNTREALDAIRADIREEYQAPHDKPWIVAISGGKDSTLLLQLVTETLLELAPSDRRRPVHVITNDTQVESPVVSAHVARLLGQVEEAADAFRLPITVAMTRPDRRESFWVLLIGRGYPAPNRLFRWCTDRLKIRPTTRYIESQVSAHGEVILLLGVRRAESAARAASVARHDGHGRLNPHGDLVNCLVFRPIVELTDEEVWQVLLQNRAPWGGTHRNLITLYRNARGECPVVTSQDDSPSCGSSSPRLGCWTCTVVEKDRSAANMVASGLDHLEPLCDFRDWLKDYSADPANREPERRNGADGIGPLSLEARAVVLDRLLALEAEMGVPLLAPGELDLIREEWARDPADKALRWGKRFLRVLHEAGTGARR